MSRNGSPYYYGSYGIVRGYGPLCKTLKEADETVFSDGREQRQGGGTTDRNAVIVTRNDGLCWWGEEDDQPASELTPVYLPSGAQACYSQEIISAHESLWNAPRELPGFL